METPADVPALVVQARAARQAGHPEEALALWRRAALIQPAHVGLRLEAAADLLTLDRPAEAEAEYQAASTISPADAGPLIGLGVCARKRGDRPAALARFLAASASDPNHIWARMEGAVELREAGRLGEAEADGGDGRTQGGHPAGIGADRAQRKAARCIARLAGARAGGRSGPCCGAAGAGGGRA